MIKIDRIQVEQRRERTGAIKGGLKVQLRDGLLYEVRLWKLLSGSSEHFRAESTPVT